MDRDTLLAFMAIFLMVIVIGCFAIKQDQRNNNNLPEQEFADLIAESAMLSEFADCMEPMAFIDFTEESIEPLNSQVNFALEYNLTETICGQNCLMAEIVNVANEQAEVIKIESQNGFSYNKESRLLKVNPKEEAMSTVSGEVATYYYEIRDNVLWPICQEKAPVPKTSAQLEEEKIILEIARAYVTPRAVKGMEFSLELTKKIDKWALVTVVPIYPITDEIGVLMHKINEHWYAETMADGVFLWRDKVPPELFD